MQDFVLPTLLALGLAHVASAVPLNASTSDAAAAGSGPCDIYASGNTPCVAAHSTTRALYGSYSGSLYQVRRGSDNATTDIYPLAAGGTANAGTQDSFCSSTTCLITIIYDQSGRGNHLTQAPPGGAASGPNPAANGYDDLASAVGAPVTLNGQKAYGVFIAPFTGYRNDRTNGVATGDNPEGMYAVFDGTHYNGNCCFDYGNAETNNLDNGAGTMEALYFGLGTGYNTGAGQGPWILSDQENGLYNSANLNQAVSQSDPTQTSRFITAVLKGNSGNQWSLRGGNANSGSLNTYFSGPRPSGYNPMQKEGAIILGIGGDNSNGAQGTFYEGVMTSGYPSDNTENSVQANIVAAGYATTSLVSGPSLPAVGSSVSFRATTSCCTNEYISHNGNTVEIQPVSDKRQASWYVRTGLGFSGCFSFESVDTPGNFIRHSAYRLRIDSNDGSKLFAEDATFCPQAGLNGQGNTFRSWSYPARSWRHYNSLVSIAANGGQNDFDATYLYNDDTSFVVESGST